MTLTFYMDFLFWYWYRSRIRLRFWTSIPCCLGEAFALSIRGRSIYNITKQQFNSLIREAEWDKYKTQSSFSTLFSQNVLLKHTLTESQLVQHRLLKVSVNVIGTLMEGYRCARLPEKDFECRNLWYWGSVVGLFVLSYWQGMMRGRMLSF
jgi:hypothetical protein